MGYAHYDTPLGAAGYDVEDHCHEPVCETVIDRGLAYLCGGTPGSPDEYGCGQWFCGEHLLGTPTGVSIMGGGLCRSCQTAYEHNHPDDSSDDNGVECVEDCPGCAHA